MLSHRGVCDSPDVSNARRYASNSAAYGCHMGARRMLGPSRGELEGGKGFGASSGDVPVHMR